MEKIKLMQTVAEALWSVADDDVGVLSPVELRDIVEGDTPLNAAVSVYMCGTTLGARIERANPCQVELYEPKETTAAEYKKMEAPGEDQDEITDNDILFLMFDNALKGLETGETDIKPDVEDLCKRTGVEMDAPMAWLIRGFCLGVCEGMEFWRKAKEAVKNESAKC